MSEVTQDQELEVYKAPKRDRWLAIRKNYITSTEIGTLAGVPKYGQTPFSIFHQKRGTLDDTFTGNERTEVGSVIEQSIAKLAGERESLRLLRLRDFMGRGKLGASFDYEVADEKSERDGWLCEIKNVDRMIYRDQWEEDTNGRPIPPDHISLQMQAQLEVSRRPGTMLAALVGGNELKVGYVLRDEVLGAALRAIANRFWAKIEVGEEPEVVADDVAHIPEVYKEVDPQNHLEADPGLSADIREYKLIQEEIKGLDARKNELKSRILLEIGDASKVYAEAGYSLDAGFTNGSTGKEITEDMVGQTIGARKGFRRFVVRVKKAGK